MARISEIIDSKTLRGTSGKESASTHAKKVHIVLRILSGAKPVEDSENGVSGVKRGWGHGLVAESAPACAASNERIRGTRTGERIIRRDRAGSLPQDPDCRFRVSLGEVSVLKVERPALAAASLVSPRGRSDGVVVWHEDASRPPILRLENQSGGDRAGGRVRWWRPRKRPFRRR